MFGLRFHVDGEKVGTRFKETRNIVVWPRDHEMDVEKDIIRGVDGFHHRRAEGDIIHEVSVHDVEVQPIGAACNGP